MALTVSKLVEASQPFLDLFELGLTPKDVSEFGYSQGGDNPHAWVTVFTKEDGRKIGTTTHRLWQSPVWSEPVVE